MQLLDWILLILPLLIVLAVGFYTAQFVKGVADFLSAGRLAGRYLLAVAQGEMQAGAVTFVAAFEVISRSGVTLTWWGWINNPFWVIVGISGFVFYRFRETRAMTLAQFFEIRYSKKFRFFCGIVGFVSGLLNFGIIPAIGARFFVYFLHLPTEVHFLGWPVPTHVALMAVFMVVTLTITLLGGLITMMITNCIEGIISQIFYLLLIFGLLSMFNWSEINTVLTSPPPGHSLLNPFDSMGLKDFNLWYVLMGMFLGLFGTGAWQFSGGYRTAAISAHESRMGNILSGWRGAGKAAVVTLLALCAMTFLQHADFSVQSAAAQADIQSITNSSVQTQMRIPVALSYLLPVGLKGALCAILLMGLFSGDSTHLHSWAGIFVQDILVPLRKKPFTAKQHMLILRLSVIGVALFAFFFGAFFNPADYIVMWWAITTSVYVGGAGAVIIGGLYWKKGTAAGAWAAMVTGSLLSVAGIVARQIFYTDEFSGVFSVFSPLRDQMHGTFGTDFPLNFMQMSFFTALITIGLYVVISLLTCRGNFNMDRMLHRGEYADKQPEEIAAAKAEIKVGGVPAPKKVSWWGKIIGLDDQFSKGDKWIAVGLFWWNMVWFIIFAIGSLWNIFAPWPVSSWSMFWHIAAIGLPVFISVVTAVWFTWGGVRDIKRLFQLLRIHRADERDDGTVIKP
jgi:SSS family solute:Na+ symporter